MQEETISAVITALGEGAVGIVRISGENALAVGEKMFRAASGKKLVEYAPNTLVYGHVYEEDSLIDEVLAVYMKAPRSYTAEDVVEIQCHGGVQSLKKILELSYKEGARPAEPGEFTKRAFLNGRIDLTQAEAVMDIIKSRSEASLKLAVRQQNGQLAKALRSLRTDLVDIIVNLEAVIDYPEEDIEDVTFGKVQESISTSCEKIENLLAHAHTGKILREGLRTAIVGRPNVGKSSLLNALLKEDRAIVSEYAGTTRDVIEEQLLLDGVPLVLADTAGIRQTDDFVEAIGVERSKQHLQDAELVICVVDGSVPLTPEDEDILEAGIRVIAQPPGKKLQNMMQLSGGEKALTAISLLFAIQNLKPSPFCLLDEIEAALDDSNVDRFAKYLHKLTKHTQFIVITHRKGTMTAADRLYGITMQEKGVSALVSVDLLEHELDE